MFFVVGPRLFVRRPFQTESLALRNKEQVTYQDGCSIVTHEADDTEVWMDNCVESEGLE